MKIPTLWPGSVVASSAASRVPLAAPGSAHASWPSSSNGPSLPSRTVWAGAAAEGGASIIVDLLRNE
ncbi:hypothetical protein HNR02_006468 [Amycolatopsis endophytica]|uniref:Uncharacterized protein n=1 Tax=Amycolatopsis endophytica TaxID=860233 RepID=A0A853BCJ9_9PSEU|nr:hypothetical protein [Amycolatopsis endophytica]NYI93093.1 hypothetical protein [Amycolatopsis endophytica]